MTLSLSGVTLRIGSATLLEGVSLELAPGEVLAVVGPNGAGKSTLVRVLAGDHPPAQGSVTLMGRPIAGWSLQDLARRRAVMGHEAPVAFPYTVEEIVLLGRGPHHGGRPRVVDRDIVAGLLAATDCGQLAVRMYATLSAGERQRVRLARAIAQITWAEGDDPTASEPRARTPPNPGTVESSGAAKPRFLLLDEPTSNLDPAHQHAALRLVRSVAGETTGVLVVLHDLNLAARYADRVAVMQEGRLVALGVPDRVLRPEVLESVFGIGMLVLRHPGLDHPLIVPIPPSRVRMIGR